MNKIYFLLILFLAGKICNAQILCIYGYDQNNPLSTGINNLVLNGGFENGCPNTGYFCPNSINYSCDITDWTCTGGGPSTYCFNYDTTFMAAASIIPEGGRLVYFGNSYCRACSSTYNDTSCIINNNVIVSGVPGGYPISDSLYGASNGVSLKQTISGLVPGNTYVLEFWAGGEHVFNSERGLFAVDVGFGNVFLRNKITPRFGGIGTRFIIEFNAASTSHTIKFTNWGHICQQCTELVLDDVRLYTLAELSSLVPHCFTGLNDDSFSQEKTEIFPTLFINQLNLRINENKLSEFILYDVASRRVLQRRFTSSISLNTSSLSRGIYLYEIRNDKGVIKKGKVVKE